MTRDEFINFYGDYVIEKTAGTGILPETLIAQAFIESSNSKGDFGASTAARDYNNYFGIKADKAWKGSSVSLQTKEYTGTEKEITIKDGFRAYDSVQDSISDYVSFLKSNPRYEKAGVFEAQTAAEQGARLLNAGYATDPNYANLIASVANSVSKKLYKKQEVNKKIKGEDAIKPDNTATLKELKQEMITQTKSKIRSKANKNIKVKKAVVKCPFKKKSDNSTPKKTAKGKGFSLTCNASNLQIYKQGGDYTLNIKAVPKSSTSDSLAIVAGYNKRMAKVKCNLTGLSGPCSGTHKSKVFDYNDSYTLKTDSKLEFDAASVYEFSFFPIHPRTNIYRLAANTCDAGMGAEITVYPDTYWHFIVESSFEGKELKEIKISGDFKEDENSVSFSVSSNKEISYDIKDDSSEIQFEGSEDGVKYGYKDDNTTVGFTASEKRVESFYEDKSTQTKSHTSFAANSLGGVKAAEVKDISFESGGIKYKIDEQLRNKLNGLFATIKFIKFIKGLLDKLSASSGTPVKFELDYPKIDLDATWQWKEIAGTPKCGFEYKVSGGFHPMIGCGVEVDLLGASLLSIPGWGPFINKVLNVIEYVSGNDLTIKLTLNGDLNIDIGVTKKANEEKPTIDTPDTHVDIVLEISAILKLKKENFIIGYGGGAKGSSKITITLHKPIVQEKGIDLPCDFLFGGITLTKVEYVKEGSSWSSVFPDETEEITEINTEIGTWLEGESHTFTVPLI